MKKIQFTNIHNIEYLEINPIPASSFIPEWYKKLEGYIGGVQKPGGAGDNQATIKKCIPVFDAITSGYLIKTFADIYVSQKDGKPFYEWSNAAMVSFHPVEQAPEHPARNVEFAYPKIMNPWTIKTPKGYSILVTKPLHRNNVINVLEGIVDTDNYFAPVNFPFVLSDPNFEGLIPAGTPIAQLIPIKRENWKMNIKNNAKQLKIIDKLMVVLRMSFYNGYKNRFWVRKHYK